MSQSWVYIQVEPRDHHEYHLVLPPPPPAPLAAAAALLLVVVVALVVVAPSFLNFISSVFSPGKLVSPNVSHSLFSINWWSMRHLRYCLAKMRQLGALRFSVNFIHLR